MDRRNLLKGTGAASLAAFAPAALGGENEKHQHDSSKKFTGLIASSSDCVNMGEECLSHSLALLAEGDQTLAGCARSTYELVTLCTALQKLAIHDSPNTPRFAKLAADACADCEKQCRKFQTMHAQCKACADACAGCIKECQKLSA